MLKLSKIEISKLFRSARRVLKHKSLDILLAPCLSGSQGRLLVITSRRVGNAPVRNTIRRRLKALFYQGEFAQKGYDCIVIIKPHNDLPGFNELKVLLETAFLSPFLPKKPS